MQALVLTLLLSVTFGLKTMAFAASVNNPKIARDYAQVQVRSVEQRSPEGVSSYQVLINGLGRELELNLESPSYSVFSSSFQYLEASEDPHTGDLLIQDFTPSIEELQSIQDNFYTDPKSFAAVSLKRETKKGEDSYQLSGSIEDMSIINRAGESLHELIKKESPNNQLVDYVDLNQTITYAKSSRAEKTSATPEVFIIFDYANTRVFGSNRNKILDYLGVFFHGINNRFATASDPKISFRISGVYIVTTLRAQPYMENNKVTGGYDIYKVLTDLSYWLYSKRQRIPKYDLAALISGTEMKSKDDSGNYQSAVSGLAYTGRACRNDTKKKRYMGSSVSEDIGGYYEGLFTVAHELAHSLGAPHDGDEGAKSCSWEDGYIMSYKGWGTKNKFYFSRCSLNLMKAYIDSSEGACTKSQQASQNIPISKDNVGDRLTMTQQCIKATKSNKAVPDPDTSANDLCKNLKCQYPNPNKPNGYLILTLNNPPGDNAPCGKGGKCVNGNSVQSSQQACRISQVSNITWNPATWVKWVCTKVLGCTACASNLELY